MPVERDRRRETLTGASDDIERLIVRAELVLDILKTSLQRATSLLSTLDGPKR